MTAPLRLWAAFTGHGFGHFAQLVAVLESLHRRHPALEVRLAGRLPRAFPLAGLSIPIHWDPHPRDVGLVQDDPLGADHEATLRAYQTLFSQWPERLKAEEAAMAAWRPHGVVANLPCLPLAAAARLGIPSVALSSLTWDRVLEAYFPRHPILESCLPRMRESYAHATLALHLEPSLPPGAFPRWEEVPPVARPGTPDPHRLRRNLGLAPWDPRPLALVSLGGIPSHHLPLDALARETGMIWITDFPARHRSPTILPLGLLEGWSFSDVLASCDAVVGKPGYGMAVEAAANGVPFLYVRRGIFPDEAPICRWMERHNRTAEITPEAFQAGAWGEPLRTLLAQPAPPRPVIDGADVAARRILTLLGVST